MSECKAGCYDSGPQCADCRARCDVQRAMQRGREDERAAIVKWLRQDMTTQGEYRVSIGDAIERGEHAR